MSRFSALLSLGAPLVFWAVQSCGASEASLRGAADAQRRLHDESSDSGNGTDDAPVVGSSSVDANLRCVDTPGWTNGWSRCNREALGNDPRYCQAGGWTCEAYVAKGWCKNDRCLQPHEINGVWACGDSLKSPEHNCCACGKSAGRFRVKCAREGCGGVYKPQNACQCTSNCGKYGNCCSDYDSVCKNTPAPTPALSPPPPASCDHFGCGRYKRGNSCQCSKKCERNNNCCDDYWSLCKNGPGPGPIVTYESYHGRNAYKPYGATNIDTGKTAPKGLTVQQCQERCTADPECSCVTFKPRNGKCWKRGNCVESGWKYANDFDVYMKNTQSCLPEHAECGGRGRRDGQCCAGSSCQRLMGSELKYCTPSTGRYYIEYYDKNAHHPYGATDIDDYFSAPMGLTAEECMDRCSADEQCSCVTQERSSGKCWKRANCHPSGWKSPHNAGYSVYMKQQPTSQSSSSSSTASDVADSEPAANATEPLLYP